MKKYILAAACAAFLFSCKEKTAEISEFAWLEGKWTGMQEGAEFFELWQPASGDKMHGLGGGVMNNDTIFSEEVSIEKREDGLYYTANVSENGAPVSFKFTGYKQDSAVFENPEHDFPQRIVYFKGPADKLYACIDGKQKGAYNKVEFSFTKAK